MKKTMKRPIQTIGFRSNSVHCETVFNQNRQQIEFALKCGEAVEYQSQLTYGGNQYVPPPQANRLFSSGVLRLANVASRFTTIQALTRDIQAFIRRYCDLPSSFEIICVHYILLSWRFDDFNELPYLRVRGDFGSGKTRFLNVVGGLAYNSIFASGASTTAPIFHLLDCLRGTLVLDESDFRFSDATAEITKILNNGHAKGFSVLRCEPVKDGGFVARAYTVFGPKIVAARESFDDTALESRFITCDLGDTPLRKDIPITLPSTFEAEATLLRNQLLWYRFHALPISCDRIWRASTQLSPRSQQIYLPLLSLVEDAEQRHAIETFILEQEAQLRSDRGLQTEADLLHVIHDLEIQSKRLTLTAVTKEFVVRYGQRYIRRITPKWIGYLLRSKLHLATRKSHGVYIISEGQSDRLCALYRKYDVV